MSRTPLALSLPLALVVAWLPVPLVAGPPEAVSAKMTFDEVADGLRKYRREEDEQKRFRLLEKLAPTLDPRVALMIYEPPHDLRFVEVIPRGELLRRYYIPNGEPLDWWWRRNRDDLRRRAKELPR